jgi:hypothetical protein
LFALPSSDHDVSGHAHTARRDERELLGVGADTEHHLHIVWKRVKIKKARISSEVRPASTFDISNMSLESVAQLSGP